MILRDEASRANEIDELQRRITLLDAIVVAAPGRLDQSLIERASTLHTSASGRLGHGTSHTVVALAGATGSGKSSLFNAISQTDFATVGVRRPTTSQALAVVFGGGADDLLNWLDIKQRQRVDTTTTAASSADLEGLVLVDLPDHDSTEVANRAEVDRLVQVVDLFMWVVDPQKYADAALHENYLQTFSGHGAVSLVVLNQADRLRADERTACMADLTKLLVEDGLQGVRVVAASAKTGDGIEGLRRELSARVAERRALIRRIDADLDWLASDLAVAIGDGAALNVSAKSRDALVSAATDAAGARAIEHAVDAAYRSRAALAVGWPPVRWLRKAKPDPLAKLGLGTKKAEENRASTEGVIVRRTAIATDPVAQGRLGEAMRVLSREATEHLPDVPRSSIVTRVNAAEAELPDALDVAAGSTELAMTPPRWWSMVGLLQTVVSIAAVVGLLWLAVLFFVTWFKLPDPPLPKVGSIPLPTILAIGGALIGLLLAAIGRRAAAIGGQRRAAKSRAELSIEVAKVIEKNVIEPVNEELSSLSALSDKIRRLAR
jgi:GTP-binding protein EngB required for normal cell division